MRKFMKLMTIATISTTAALQVTACTDNSKYDTFISDINSTTKNNTAFFGFLGSADDTVSQGLQDVFDALNQKGANESTPWEEITNDWKDSYLKGAGLQNIYLKYYQGPYHQNAPSDPADSFWNDKNITWQQNIFSWIYSRANHDKNPAFNPPKDPGNNVKPIEAKKDGNTDKFTKLPIVFIISKGKLITAGQEWLPSTPTNYDEEVETIKNFILANLFS